MKTKFVRKRSNGPNLVWAAKGSDRLAIVRAIRAGADLNGEDIGGWTPLFHAAARGDTRAVKLLLEAGADVNHGQSSGFTALFAAVLGGHLTTAQVLLGAGAFIVPVQGIQLAGYVSERDSPKGKRLLCLLSASTAEGNR